MLRHVYHQLPSTLSLNRLKYRNVHMSYSSYSLMLTDSFTLLKLFLKIGPNFRISCPRIAYNVYYFQKYFPSDSIFAPQLTQGLKSAKYCLWKKLKENFIIDIDITSIYRNLTSKRWYISVGLKSKVNVHNPYPRHSGKRLLDKIRQVYSDFGSRGHNSKAAYKEGNFKKLETILYRLH